MRLGSIEGNPEEIKDLVENHGLNLDDYIQKAEVPLHCRWLIIPAVIFALPIIATFLFPSVTPKTTIFFFLIGGGGIIWLATTVQIRFKNAWATGFMGVGLLLLLLVGFGFMEPEDLLAAIEKFKSK